MQGRVVNLTIDPPPDLVAEVDITNTNIEKNVLYAAMRIPEFWRYNDQALRIFYLAKDKYHETETSLAFPNIAKVFLYPFFARL